MRTIEIPTSYNFSIKLVETTYDVEIHVDNRLFATIGDKKIDSLNSHAIRHWVEKEYIKKQSYFESQNYQAPHLLEIEDEWMYN